MAEGAQATNGYGCGHKKNVTAKKSNKTISNLPPMPYCFYFSDKVESQYAPELEKKGWLLAKKEVVRYLGDFKITIYRYPINGHYYFDIYHHKLQKIFFTQSYKPSHTAPDMILPIMMKNAERCLSQIKAKITKSCAVTGVEI